MEIDSFDPRGKKFLCISAHPDDADFSAGGTLLKWISQGAKGAIVIVTNGDKGSHDRKLTHKQLVRLRQKEQLSASKFLGLEKTWFLGYPDAHLEVQQELKGQLVKIIRQYRPDIVLTFDPSLFYSLERTMINHPDHRAVGQATLDAVFPMARDFLTFHEHAKDGLEPHCVCDLFLYNWDRPNYFVDTEKFIDKKLKLLSFHESQVNLEKLEDDVKSWSSKTGEKCGSKYAEGFIHVSLETN